MEGRVLGLLEDRRFRRRLGSGLVLLVVLWAGLLTWLGQRTSQAATQRVAAELARQAAGLAAGARREVRLALLEAGLAASSATTTQALRQPDDPAAQTAVQAELLRLARPRPEYNAVEVIDTAGRSLLRVSQGSLGPFLSPRPRSERVPLPPEVTSLAAGQWHLTDGAAENPSSRQAALHLVVPAVATDGERLGLLSIHLDGAALLGQIAGAVADPTTRLLAVTSAGQWVAAAEANPLLAELPADELAILAQQVSRPVGTAGRHAGRLLASQHLSFSHWTSPPGPAARDAATAGSGDPGWTFVLLADDSRHRAAVGQVALAVTPPLLLLLVLSAVALVALAGGSVRQTELNELRNRHGNLIDQLPVGLVAVEQAGEAGDLVVRETNAAFLGLTRSGSPAAARHGDAAPQLHPPCHALLSQVLTDGQPASALVRHFEADGSLRWLELRGFPVGEGSAIGLQHDVTGRVAVERENARLSVLLASLFEEAPLLLLLADTDGRILRASQHLAHLCDCGAEDLVGRRPDEVFAAETARILDRGHRQAMASASLLTRTETVEFLPGEPSTWVWHRLRLSLNEGEPPVVLSLALDISELTSAVQVVRERTNWLALTVELADLLGGSRPVSERLSAAAELLCRRARAAVVRLWSYDGEGQAPRLVAVAGRLPDHLLDSDPLAAPCALLRQAVEDRRPALVNNLDAAALERAFGDAPQVQPRAAGVFPLATGDRLLGVLAVFTDQPISPAEADLLALAAALATQALDRERLRRRATESEESGLARGTFLAGLSHQLRTPLNGVLGFAHVLRDDRTLTSRQRELAESIAHGGEQLLRLISDIGLLVRADAGRLQSHPTAVDPARLLTETVGPLHGVAAAKGLTLQVEPAESLPPVVEADEQLLRQILGHLLDNAIKYTSAGSVTLRAEVQRADSGCELVCEVTDTGAGMSEDQLQAVFAEPGARAGRSGAGLGLALSQRLARAMGGGLTATSQPGAGSCFRLAVPMIGRPAHPAAASTRRIVGMRPDARLRRVLVADDDVTSRQLLRLLLSRLGLEVVCVSNGQEVLRALADDGPFQLVLMDMMMPVMDGYEATRQVKASAPSPPPVVAVTAAVLDAERERMKAAGVDGILTKPVVEQELMAVLAGLSPDSFSYADEPAAEPGAKAVALPDLPEPPLPPAVAEQLVAAVEAGYYDTFGELLDQVADTRPALASRLREQAARFATDELIATLRPDA